MFVSAIRAFLVLAIVLSVSTAQAQEQGSLELRAISEVEIEIEKDNGEVELRRIPADKVVPGDQVVYTIFAKNIGAEDVTSVVVVDPIPEHMGYSAGSAFGDGTVITFSVDGGKTYDPADALVVRDVATQQLRTATADDYTHIKWAFNDAIEPGSTRMVRFRARLQ